MSDVTITISNQKLLIQFHKELTLHNIQDIQNELDLLNKSNILSVQVDLTGIKSIDTAAAIFLRNLKKEFFEITQKFEFLIQSDSIFNTLEMVKIEDVKTPPVVRETLLETLGRYFYDHYLGVISFLHFLGNLFVTKLHYLSHINNFRFKEVAFDINESGIKAIPIIVTISFLIGLVIAYQSAYQLKLYGANIFLVDMVGIALLRELAPLITAVVIAGRSGSVFTAQIGSMKITEEIDAMRSMGFDPYVFLVMPRILSLVLVMPILIFIADIVGVLGAMIIANIDLGISPLLFTERFLSAVDIKHFFIGISKGPFFAFLIATIGIYRGLKVKNDTLSIGHNTTKSVVESIFAVIICDAIFSIIFTNFGI